MNAPPPYGMRSTASRGCEGDNLVIECDGSQHFTDEGLGIDRIKNEALVNLD